MTDGSTGIFEDLPEALVSDMLDNTNAVGDTLLKSFREANSKKEVMRKKLTELGLGELPSTESTGHLRPSEVG